LRAGLALAPIDRHEIIEKLAFPKPIFRLGWV